MINSIFFKLKMLFMISILTILTYSLCTLTCYAQEDVGLIKDVKFLKNQNTIYENTISSLSAEIEALKKEIQNIVQSQNNYYSKKDVDSKVKNSEVMLRTIISDRRIEMMEYVDQSFLKNKYIKFIIDNESRIMKSVNFTENRQKVLRSK